MRQPLQLVRRRSVDQRIFEAIELLPNPFEHAKVAVDHGVQQHIGGDLRGKGVMPLVPGDQLAATALEKIVIAVLLEREGEVLSNQQRYLLRDQRGIGGVETQDFEDQKGAVWIVLKLHTLVGIEYVFQQQGMQFKLLADRLNQFRRVHPVNIKPDRTFAVEAGKGLAKVLVNLHGQPALFQAHRAQHNSRTSRGQCQRHQRSWHHARFARSLRMGSFHQRLPPHIL